MGDVADDSTIKSTLVYLEVLVLFIYLFKGDFTKLYLFAA